MRSLRSLRSLSALCAYPVSSFLSYIDICNMTQRKKVTFRERETTRSKHVKHLKRAKYEIRKVQFHAGNCKSLDTVIPISMARQLKIVKGDSLKIVKKGSKIILQKMK